MTEPIDTGRVREVGRAGVEPATLGLKAIRSRDQPCDRQWNGNPQEDRAVAQSHCQQLDSVNASYPQPIPQDQEPEASGSAYGNPIADIALFEFNAYKSGDEATDDARSAFVDLCWTIRKRLWSGYDPRYCMEDVEGRQCRRLAQYLSLFWEIVGFCNQHDGWPRHVYRNVISAERDAKVRGGCRQP